MNWPRHLLNNLDENRGRIQSIVNNSLTTDELRDFHEIRSNLLQLNSDEETAVLIDWMGYDTKLFMLLYLSTTLDRNITYIVFRRTLAETFHQARNISGYTVHKFFMVNFDLRKDEVDMRDDGIEWYRMLHKIIKSVSQLKKEFDILILDEYTILSPWYVLWMYWIAKYHKVPILFSGDKSMVESMHRSNYHNGNNYSIAKVLAEPRCYNLYVVDSEYRRKLAQLKQILDENNVPLMDEFIPRLRSLFPEKVLLEENFEAMFLSRYHVNLYQRAYRIKQDLDRRHISYYCSPYYTIDMSTNQYRHIPIDTLRERFEGRFKNKYLEFLLLIENFMYTYTRGYGDERIVKIKAINLRDDTVTNVIVTDVEDNNEYQLKVVKLEGYHCTIEEYNWLTNDDTEPVYQYPLRLLCKTYHNIEGSTVPTCCKVELDLYGSETANVIYVGLSSVTTEEQLGKIDINNACSNTVGESNESQLSLIAKYLRDVPSDDIVANSNSPEDLKCHFEHWLTNMIAQGP